MLKEILLCIIIAISINIAVYANIQTKTTTQNIQVGQYKLQVEIAKTEGEHRRGLMFRKNLKENSGMLFIFEEEQYLAFWMKNTYIPLDIAFFDEDKLLINYTSMTPLSLELVRSSKEAKYALEVNKNWFSERNIKIGSKLTILAKGN